jgi:hypothetical protein
VEEKTLAESYIKMKSAYELAMERLNKTSPTKKLTPEQKARFAELESKYAAKIAEKEISMKGEMDRLADSGEFEKLEQLQQQLVRERKKLQADLEEKKEELREGKS